MKRQLLVFFSVLFTSLYGQDFSVSLLDCSILRSGAQNLVLLENDTFIVAMENHIFKEEFEKWITEQPHIKEDKVLYRAIFNDSTIQSNAYSIANRLGLIDRLKFRIGNMLRKGLCWVYNKKKRLCEEQVRIVYYETENVEYRKYLVGGLILLDLAYLFH